MGKRLTGLLRSPELAASPGGEAESVRTAAAVTVGTTGTIRSAVIDPAGTDKMRLLAAVVVVFTPGERNRRMDRLFTAQRGTGSGGILLALVTGASAADRRAEVSAGAVGENDPSAAGSLAYGLVRVRVFEFFDEIFDGSAGQMIDQLPGSDQGEHHQYEGEGVL